MKLIAALNKDIDFGRALNAIAHLSLAIGAKDDSCMTHEIDIVFLDQNQIKIFRKNAWEMQHTTKKIHSFIDFTHCMSSGNASDQIKVSRSTSTEDLSYYAVLVKTSTEANLDIFENIGAVTKLKDYDEKIKLNSEQRVIYSNSLETRENFDHTKITLVLPKKAAAQEWIKDIVVSSMLLGKITGYENLKITSFYDHDENENQESHHTGSAHQFPILSASSVNKLSTISLAIDNLENTDTILHGAVMVGSILCLIGNGDNMNQISGLRSCSLYNRAVPEDDFEIREIT